MIPFEEAAWLFTSDVKTRGIIRMNIGEAAMLYKYCRKKPNGTFVEIGRKLGGSTFVMAAALEQGHLHTIDIRDRPEAHENTKMLKDKITFINSPSEKVNWTTPIDMVFIDGDHSFKALSRDVKSFCPHVVSGGYAAFHDVIGKKKELWPIMQGLMGNGWKLENKINSMLVLQKETKK